jgi:hypothetical protein
MQRVFLSYAREDLEAVERIEQQLAEKGVTAWRDESLVAGQIWPKALGEAIAKSDALLLLWSGRAAESTFVELEWCTAVALKKAVLPCLLDRTPLPPSLAAIEAVPADGIAASIGEFLCALAGETKSPDESHIKKVVRQLDKVGAGAPAEVLNRAKAVFAQRDWTVQGPVYQAGGDIHIGTPPPRKARLETWQAWVAIVTGILIAVTLGLALVRNYIPEAKKQETSSSQRVVTKAQVLAGQISDDRGEPLANVGVSVLLEGKLVANRLTDSRGLFNFQIDGPAEAEVTLLAQKDGYPMEKRYTHLGDPGFNFKMGGKQP